MKKILLIISLFFIIFLTGCSNKIQTIIVEDINVCIDIFDITDYEFIVVYEDGTEERVQMSLEMFSSEDQSKFYEIGEHKVLLTYNKFTQPWTITLEERKAIGMIANPSFLSSYVQEFEYSMITLEINYNDNTTENIVLSRDILDNDDIISLGKAGTYDITVDYEDVSATFTVELLPNEIPIEELNKDVVIYCITKKIDDVYQAKFYALGNKDFSSLQFKLNKNSKVNSLQILNKHNNLFINEEELSVTFVSSENIKGTVELFTLQFTSSQQYRNFTVDYDMDTKIIYIKNNEVEEISNYIFTFTR